MNDEIKEKLKLIDGFFNKAWACDIDEVYHAVIDTITNLQQELEEENERLKQYENPDDLTLFYMWLDEKAKDKMKQLQQENERLIKELENISLDEANIRADVLLEQQDYKSRIEKAVEYIELYTETIKVDNVRFPFELKELNLSTACRERLLNILNGKE